MIDEVTDADPEELEQLARSLAMAPVLGQRDRQAVIDALRQLAAIERAKRRHPSGQVGARPRALESTEYEEPEEK